MSLTNRRIRQYNKACYKRECHNECDGIGWCEEVYATVRKHTNNSIRFVSAVIFIAGIGGIGFVIGYGIYRLLAWLL